MSTITYDREGRKHWRGRSRERTEVTVYNLGDEFYCWDTGIVWEIRDPGVGWEIKERNIPLPTKIDPDTYEVS